MNLKLHHYELYLVEVIKGYHRGPVPFVIKMALRFFSWLYRFVVWGRNRAYDQGWLRQYIPPIPVVSVGNIVSGGTGKTPATMLLAQQFHDKFQVAILSRGYRSPVEKLPSPIVVSGGRGPLHPATFCGDEPYLLAKNLPKTFIIVGRDRRKASSMAVAAGAQLILLDDGMQHRGLARDFEIVVLDGNDPFGKGDFLPAGFLREGVSALSRADLILVNHTPALEKFNDIKEHVVQHTKAPVVATKTDVVHVWDFKGRDLGNLQGRRIGMFCGIAQPEYFHKTLEDLGAQVVAEHFTADHIGMDLAGLHRFAAECLEKKADLMVCTEKDKVRLSEHISLPIELAWVQIQLSISHGEAEWCKFLDEIRKKITL